MEEKDQESQLQALQDDNNAVVVVTAKESSNCRTKVNSLYQRYRKRYLGIGLALISSILFPLAALLVKALVKYHPYNVALWRFQGVVWPSLLMTFYHECVKKEDIFRPLLPPTEGSWKTLLFSVLRGLTGPSAVVFQFSSLHFITVADSAVISFSTPVWVTLIAHFTLGEKCGVVPIIAGIFGVVGVFVIARPPILTGAEAFDLDTVKGVSLALGCMICATSTFIVLRYLRKLHYAVSSLFTGVFGTVECLLLSLLIWKLEAPKNSEDWILAVALAVISFITQLCMTLAFKFESAGVISLIRTSDVIFTFIWQFAVFGVVPDRYSVVGALIVLSGIFMVGMRKYISELPSDDRKRVRWSFLLV